MTAALDALDLAALLCSRVCHDLISPVGAIVNGLEVLDDNPTPDDRDYCRLGTFGPHNLHENRPGSFQSEERLFATYNNAGVRVFDIRDAFAPKAIASWVPPAPAKLIDPRPNVALAAKSADIYVTPDGLMFVSDWNAGLNVLQYEG